MAVVGQRVSLWLPCQGWPPRLRALEPREARPAHSFLSSSMPSFFVTRVPSLGAPAWVAFALANLVLARHNKPQCEAPGKQNGSAAYCNAERHALPAGCCAAAGSCSRACTSCCSSAAALRVRAAPGSQGRRSTASWCLLAKTWTARSSMMPSMHAWWQRLNKGV